MFVATDEDILRHIFVLQSASIHCSGPCDTDKNVLGRRLAHNGCYIDGRTDLFDLRFDL